MSDTNVIEEVEYRTARPGTLRAQVAEYMQEHATSPMLSVLPGIQEILAKDGKPANLRAAWKFYVWCVENRYAPGVVENLQRSVTPTVSVFELDGGQQLVATTNTRGWPLDGDYFDRLQEILDRLR